MVLKETKLKIKKVKKESGRQMLIQSFRFVNYFVYTILVNHVNYILFTETMAIYQAQYLDPTLMHDLNVYSFNCCNIGELKKSHKHC